MTSAQRSISSIEVSFERLIRMAESILSGGSHALQHIAPVPLEQAEPAEMYTPFIEKKFTDTWDGISSMEILIMYGRAFSGNLYVLREFLLSALSDGD